MKYCSFCKKQVSVTVDQEGTPLVIPGFGWLVRLLAGSETHINRIYSCAVCHEKIRGKTLWNALLVPLLLIVFIFGSVVLFITYILLFVS